MSDAGDARLTFETLALRRELASDHCELAPVAAPQLAAYGSEEQTTAELQLALGELADEARPTTVARFLLPDGVLLFTGPTGTGKTELATAIAEYLYGDHSLERIVELELAKLRLRPGVVARNLELSITPAARSRLAQLGHDPRLGARPLRRTIEDLVVAPIAERIAREPTWRDTTVRITTSEERGDIRV